MLLFVGIGLLCFGATAVHAQPAPPHLVKDINQSTGNSKPEHFTSVGSTLYFVADDGVHGRELWKTDGSANGTVLVKDIVPGATDSAPTVLYNYNGALFFVPKDGNDDYELWKSDGSAAGTLRVKDINPTGSSFPGQFATFNNILYFIADDGVHGAALWRSDGTEANTVLVKAIPDVTGNKGIRSLAVVNGTIVIFAYGANNVVELWRSDGTENGTTLVQDISANAQSQLFNEREVVNGNLYFATEDNTSTFYLWKSDGTSAGTMLVKQMTPPSGGYNQINAFTAIGNTLYFLASNAPNFQTCSVWKSDGTTNGTRIVTACAGDWLAAVNNKLYFVGDDASTGKELWQSDGTLTGSALVKDITPGVDSSLPSFGANVGGVLYFFDDDQTQRGLWRSDGTVAGTTLVKKLDRSGVFLSPGGSVPFAFYNWNGIAYFSAEDGQRLENNDSQAGYEPWKSDGTAAGTGLVQDINSITNSAYPERLTLVGNVLYFLARDPINAQELWKSSGTVASTTLLSDINPDGIGARIQEVVGGAHLVYLQAYSDSGSEIWRSDGTVAGTFRLKPFPNSDTTRILAMIADGDTLYFVISETSVGWTLWKSDGTTVGTVPVTLLTTTGGATMEFLLARKGVVYFTLAQNVENQLQYQWWRSDGTAAGTMLLKDFSPGWMMAAGDTLYLAAFSNGQTNLWKSDGTAAGTVLVKSGVADTLPAQQVVMNGILYFRGYDSAHGWELWKSDGTDAGTTLLNDINPGNDGSDPAYFSHFVVDNGTLYFAAKDTTGYGLWKSDGSEAGTVLVKSIFSPGAGPYQFTIVNQHLYFLNELNNGNKELWISDGTAAGTKPLQDLKDSVPGLPYGYAVTLVGSTNNIYFVANDPNVGFELWTLAELSTVEATSDAYMVTQGTVLVVPAPGVLGNDHDANAGVLSAALQANPTHGVVALHADGSFIYTPTANFAGSDAFTYRASNSGAISATGVVALTIVPVPNQAPVATNDVFTITLTGALTLDVLDNDTDANSDGLTITKVTQPAHGTATITNNKIVYTPTSDFSGTDSFTYTVSDGKGGEATATVTVHAKSANRSLFLPLVRR